jgi:serine phosphatase RsbU (regulator of sigma subunit)
VVILFIIKKNDQNLFVIVADVQGHGIGSSVIVGMLKIILDFFKRME